MNEFYENNQELLNLIKEWEPKLLQLPKDVITQRRNSQNRTIKVNLGRTWFDYGNIPIFILPMLKTT